MKITMTNLQMEQAGNALSAHTDATGKIGYAVAWNLQAIKQALLPYIQVKQNILDNYGHKDTEHEGRYIIDDGEKIKEMAELMAMECEIDIRQIDEETFLDWGLTAAEMEPLVWMVAVTKGG